MRHYDQIGLLKPSALDPDTGYRYYSLDQLPRLHRILALKELGFPLEHIAQLLEGNLSLEQLRGMFHVKQIQVQQAIDKEQTRLAHIAARLRQIEQEGKMPAYDIILKQVEPLLVASISEQIGLREDPGHLHTLLIEHLNQRNVQHLSPPLVLWHSHFETRETGVYADIEAALPLQTAVAGTEQIRVQTLSGGWVASTIHAGDNLLMGQAYAALYRWVAANGYQIIGYPRQLYHQRLDDVEPERYVTEVQFPIERIQPKV